MSYNENDKKILCDYIKNHDVIEKNDEQMIKNIIIKAQQKKIEFIYSIEIKKDKTCFIFKKKIGKTYIKFYPENGMTNKQIKKKYGWSKGFLFKYLKTHTKIENEDKKIILEKLSHKYPYLKNSKNVEIKNNKYYVDNHYYFDKHDVEFNKIQIFTKLLRNEIRKQRDKFKKNSNNKCDICGSNLNLTVDHIIKFKILRNNFIKKYDINIDENIQYRNINVKIRKLWLDYHKDNSKLRILCKKCNDKEK